MAETWQKSLITLYLGMFIALAISFGVIWIPHIAIHEHGFEISTKNILVDIFFSFIICIICTLISKCLVLPFLNTCDDSTLCSETSAVASRESDSQPLTVEQQKIEDSFRNMENELNNLNCLNSKARITLRRRAGPSARSLSIITMSTLERIRSSGTRTPLSLDISPIQRVNSENVHNEVSDDQLFELGSVSSGCSKVWNPNFEDGVVGDNSDVFEKAIMSIQLSDINDLSQSVKSQSKLHDSEKLSNGCVEELTCSSKIKSESVDKQDENVHEVVDPLPIAKPEEISAATL